MFAAMSSRLQKDALSVARGAHLNAECSDCPLNVRKTRPSSRPGPDRAWLGELQAQVDRRLAGSIGIHEEKGRRRCVDDPDTRRHPTFGAAGRSHGLGIEVWAKARMKPSWSKAPALET